ncbi:MAG: endonuclease/exonuclease/phosphatase family protein [Planctomycetota bacterium]
MQLRWSNLVLLSALPACPSALAPFVAHWHWSLDLLACFPVQAMAWLLLTSALLFAARRPKPAAALLALAVAAAVPVLPVFWHSPPAAIVAGPARTVRVLSLNLLRENHARAADALAVIREHDPDVLFCSELTPAWLAALSNALPQFPHRSVRTDPGWFGIALFSRWPVRAEVIPLGFEWAPAVRASVATPHGELGVLGVHTPRPGNGRRCAERDEALAAIPEALTPLPGARLVLGDCNATPWNAGFRDLLAATGLVPANDGWQPTWTTTLPWPLRIPIDHVLVGGGVGVLSCRVGESFGSDHLPLSATLQLPR